MIGKQFKTLEDWTRFLDGKSVYIIRETHPNYREKCRFVEMVGINNIIDHPSNQNGHAIRMKVKTMNGHYLLLIPGDFFIEEKEVKYSFPNNGMK